MRRTGWVFMRISGLLLVVLVAGHIITNLLHGDGVRQINFAFVAGKWANPLWQIWALLLLVFALAHGFNGLRTIVSDYARRPGARSGWLIGAGIVAVLMLAVGTLVIFTFDPCPPGAPAHLLPDFCPLGGG